MTTSFVKALNWIHNNLTEDGCGIVITDKQRILYPEVTGYFIPSLLDIGEYSLAEKFALHLCELQNPNGFWSDARGSTPFIFDSGQILKGLVAIFPLMPQVKTNIQRGTDWILSCMDKNGRLVQPSTELWGNDDTHCNELIHLYALSPIFDAATICGRNDYVDKANSILDYYTSTYQKRIEHFTLFAHFYAYVIEGLIDCGRSEMARTAMANLEPFCKQNGAISAYPNANWVCSTSLFQFAIIWYKLGEYERANKTYEYGCSLQNPSGGWYGSYDYNKLDGSFNRVLAKLGLSRRLYLKDEEISWAVKFFLDATKLKKSE